MYNPFSLAGKSILVTGASSGIGAATAIECSKMGAKVILVARNSERLLQTMEKMENRGLHQVYSVDLSDDGAISKLINFIESPLNGIVHSAGVTITKPFQYLSREDLNGIMRVNFEAPVLLTQQLVKCKKIQKMASVVFISSVSGVYCSSFAGSAYSASKGAINGIVKGMAIDLASREIRVNCINPGMVHSNILSEGIITQEQLDNDVKRYPLKRYGEPSEVAQAAVYLLSDTTKWMTGSNLLIDGGYTLL